MFSNEYGKTDVDGNFPSLKVPRTINEPRFLIVKRKGDDEKLNGNPFLLKKSIQEHVREVDDAWYDQKLGRMVVKVKIAFSLINLKICRTFLMEPK